MFFLHYFFQGFSQCSYQEFCIRLLVPVSMGNDADVERAKVAMAKTKKYCLISNSVNAEIVQHPEVVISKQHAVINSAV